MEETKILLKESEMPDQWYNIISELPDGPPPVLHPGTHQPIGPEDLSPIFPMRLIEQEMSSERWIPIPEEVKKIYSLWRPTPLYRARRLEEYLNTPAKIYYKYEGVSPPGSHKPNTSVAQAYYNKKEGVKRLATETGAGQWGSALSMACNLFDLECTVYMVKVSYQQKPYRRSMIHAWGAEVFPSPSDRTESGRAILAKDPESRGSLGLAISEAVEDAATHEDTNYSLGSVLNHVCLHQSIVGLEAKKQFDQVGDYPDIVVGCCGGGSNFAGIAFPFVREKMDGKDIRFIAVEPISCPTLTKGLYTFDYGDTAKQAPIVKMYTLGHDFIPPAIHAGGLRYHGDSPLVSLLAHEGIIEGIAVPQTKVFKAGVDFARCEGIIPAPETNHAIQVVMDEALQCKESGEAKTILFNLSGHGHFDMSAYDSYFAQDLVDYEYPEENIKKSLEDLPKIEMGS